MSNWKLVPLEPTEEMLRAAWGNVVNIADLARDYRKMLAAAPTPPVQSHHELDDADIREIALDCGFKLKPQPDGLEDLNHYVYKFARELLSTIPRPEDVAALREQLTPSSQEDEPVAVSINGKLANLREPLPHGTELYTRPDNSELRKAAEEDEPYGYLYENDNEDPLFDYARSEWDAERSAEVKLYTRPDNSGLRQAAEELISTFDRIKCLESRYGPCPAIEDLRAALEGK